MRPSIYMGFPVLLAMAFACPSASEDGAGAALPEGRVGTAVPEDSAGAPLRSDLQPQGEEALEGEFLYKVVLLRAAPGRLLDLIELLKEERDLFGDVEEPLPYWMRHTQGDQWDLMIFYPMGSFHDYFEPQRLVRRLTSGEWKGLSEEQLRLEADLLTAWRDEIFVRGPGPEVLERAFRENAYYHVEMFVALAGRRRDLLEERRMENRYLQELGRPQNLIFVREAGGPWDSFTVGFYRDLKHYAETADLLPQDQERAAVAAGFQGADRIGTYLRRLIQYHRDTFCVPIT